MCVVALLVAMPAPAVVRALAAVCDETFWFADHNYVHDWPRWSTSTSNPRVPCGMYGTGFRMFFGALAPDGTTYGFTQCDEGALLPGLAWGRFDPAGTNGVFYKKISDIPRWSLGGNPIFPTEFPPFGQPLGYRFHSGEAQSTNPGFIYPVQLYAIDAIAPYYEHKVFNDIGTGHGEYNPFPLGGVLKQDGSKIWYVTQTLIFELNLQTGPPAYEIGRLQLFNISRNASVTASSRDGEIWIFDGSAAFLFDANAGEVVESMFVQGATQIVDSGVYPCTPGGMRIEPHHALLTTESGGTATFTAVLTAPPAQNVTVNFTSTDTTEGTVTPASATFTNANWSTPQTITVTGVADSDTSNKDYQVVTSALVSADPNFSGRAPLDVNVTNVHVNQPPSMTTASPSVQQGSPTATITLATASDLESAASALTVETVTPPAGITAGTLQYANGAVSAPVAAPCAATVGAHPMTLRVTDPQTASSDQVISITVTANTAPSLGTYPTATVGRTNGGIVAAGAPPADNGSVSAVEATSPTFTGSLSVNASTGAVTIANAGPVGTHTVTVTATDNCGTTTSRTFMLAVSRYTDPVITAGATLITAAQITELREQIDQLRSRAGLAAFGWDTPALTAGVTLIRARHIEDLRTALAEAFVAAAQTPPSFTDSSLTAGATPIRAVHFTELRAAAEALESLLP